MNPKRLSLKFFVAPDPRAALDLEPVIAVFHRFIQQRSVPGLLIDVADYTHVPNGPGVMLVGHEVDYALDRDDGRLGLLVTRKRGGALGLADALRELHGWAQQAADALEASGIAGLRFERAHAEFVLLDRLAAANDAAGFRAVSELLRPLLGAAAGIEHLHAEDPARALTLALSLPADAPLRAGSAAPTALAAEIEVEELRALRESGADFVLLDVREASEVAICTLGGQHIPLAEVEQRRGELAQGARIVVHCRSGVRSAKAAELLRAAGFTRVQNLRGGILAWIDRIDPGLTRY